SLLFAAADDQLVGRLLRLARPVAEGRLAPWSLRIAAGAGLALTTTMGMVPRVHRRTANGGPDSEPPAAAGLPARLVLVLDVTDLADGGLAAHVDAAQLAGRHADDGVVAFLRKQLRRRARRTDELATATERQLDVVDRRADRDVRQRNRVADADRRLLSALDGIADLQAER